MLRSFAALASILLLLAVPVSAQVITLPQQSTGGGGGSGTTIQIPQSAQGNSSGNNNNLAPGLSGNNQPEKAPAIGTSQQEDPATITRKRVEQLRKAGYTPEQIFQILQKEADSVALVQAEDDYQFLTPEGTLKEKTDLIGGNTLGGAIDTSRKFYGEVEIGVSKDSTYVIVEEYNDMGEKRQRKKPLSPRELEKRRELDKSRKEMEQRKLLDMIFGQAIFTDESVAGAFLSDTANTSPSDTYVIGPGDVFTITAWGAAELFESLLVAQDGSVGRQFLGKIYLSGRTYAEARQILRQRYLSMIDPRAQIEVTLAPQRRLIPINIVGEAVRPGKYSIPATMSAFTAMFIAKGVNALGSVRAIQIKRDGKTIQTMDVYDYLLEGKTNPIYLRAEDFVFVPVQGRIVQVQGAIRRPSRYELTDQETLGDLVRFAGGLLYDAKTADVQLSRFVDGKQQILNFNFEKGLSEGFKLLDGDVITIASINRELRNVISANGALFYPNSYELRKNDRITDLLLRAGGLREGAYLERAYLRRRISPLEFRYIPVSLSGMVDPLGKILLSAANDTNNLVLQEFDELTIFSRQDFFTSRRIIIQGAVNRPDTFPLMPTLTLKALLFLAGGPREDADLSTIILSNRLNPEDINAPSLADTAGMQAGYDTTSSALVRRIGIDKNWQTDPSLDTLLLADYASVRIYSKLDFAFPEKISVTGAVRRPREAGIYRGMTLKDAILLAGGLSQNLENQTVDLYARLDPRKVGISGMGTTDHSISRIVIGRDWMNDPRLDTFMVSQFSRITVRNPTEFMRPGFADIKGLVAKPGKYATVPGMTLKDLLYSSGGMDLSANFKKIEVTRILDSISLEGEIRISPVKELTISVSQNWQTDPQLDTFLIYPFDQIFVRQDPNFRLQESVRISGEVMVPGEYNKLRRDERLASIVLRAGGPTDLSYNKGAYIMRPEVGKVALRLDKAIQHPRSRHNIIILEGDALVVPMKMSVVKIAGNVWSDSISIAYDKRVRRMRYYSNLAGGFKKRTSRKDITVEYMDGRVKKAHNFIFFRTYPKVEEGAVIRVPVREEGRLLNRVANLNLNLSETVKETTALGTSVLTLVVLLRTITR